jgi:hypothetical protein
MRLASVLSAFFRFILVLVPCYAERQLKLDLYDAAGLDAAGANAHALGSAIDFGLHWLEVYIPAAAGLVVRVRDVVTELRAFAAEITFGCHCVGAPELEYYRLNRNNFPLR